MNFNHETRYGNQRPWIATRAANPWSPLPTNWQTFPFFHLDQGFFNAEPALVADSLAVGAFQGQHNGHPREIIRASGTPTQSTQLGPMGATASQTLTYPQAPKSALDGSAPSKGRKRQPPVSTWNKHKSKLYDIYITQNLTLEDTMELMEKEDGFCPSIKMYKQKFKMWKWSKKLPRVKAEWMLGRANERGKAVSNEPKDTIFEWGNQDWTVDRIRQSVGRRNEAGDPPPQDGPTPSDVVVKTPICVAESLRNPALPDCSRTPGGPWTPSPPPSTGQPRKTSSFRLRWNNLTLKDVQSLQSEAARFEKDGDFISAEDKFRDVLSGFATLLSPTHEETTIAAYQLASFFANQDRMKEADRVLDWLGGNYIQRWGLNHGKTIAHLIRVIELLQSWERGDDAFLLLSRILDSWDDLDSDLASTVVALSSNAAQDTELDELDPDVVEQIFEESSDEAQVESQLRVASLWSSSRVDGLEAILVRLIQQCEKHPEKLKVQTLHARCILAGLYSRLKRRDLATTVLEMAQRSLMEMLAINENLPISILKASRQLAFAYVGCNDIEGCDYVLERVAERLESMLGDGNDQTGVAVSFLTDVARDYQRLSGWQNAAPWFERALAISLIAFGFDDRRTKRLEAALQNQQYSVNAGTFEDFENLLKSGAQNFTLRLGY